jgi:hypothetical protein
MAIFHLITVTPVTNHPQAREHLELGNFMVHATDSAAAWNAIKGRKDVVPASEVWAAQTDESQQVLLTPHFKGRENEDWATFVKWSQVQERYHLVHRADVALSEWAAAKFLERHPHLA